MAKNCYLDQEEIPPISELDHAKKNCFCYLCTCGEHKCPSLSSYKQFSPKCSSSYREKFSRKPFIPSQPFAYINEIIPSQGKMDLKSTTNEDFKGCQLENPKKSKGEYRDRSVSPFRLNGTSTYSRNYISYGPIVHSPNVKIVSDYSPMKFMATSSYAQQFIKHGKVAENFDKQLLRRNIIGTGGAAILETTNNSTYTKHKTTFLSTPFRYNSVEPNLKAFSPTMTTTYGTSFFNSSPKSLKPTLRQLEKLKD